MPKFLKKYNEKTGKWEIFSPTSTDDVSVSNTSFNTTEQPTSKLTDVLNNIGEDIEKLKRNVSWLAEHGGSGGGIGTGGPTAGYKIIVTNAGIQDDVLYVSNSAFTVTFKIEGASNEIVKYKVFYDGEPLSSKYTETKTNTTVAIQIDNIEMIGSVTPHSMIIEGIDNNGMAIPSCRISIIETSIKIEANNTQLVAGGNGLFNVFVTNKMLGSQTSVKVTNNSVAGQSYVTTYNNVEVGATIVPINFFKDLMKDVSPIIGSTYNLRIEAFATTSNNSVIQADPIFVKISIIGSNQFVITLDGISEEDDYNNDVENGSEYFLGGSIVFSFTPFLTNNTTNYYAIRMVRNTNSSDTIDIAGNIDAIDHTTNPFMTTGSKQIINSLIPKDTFYEGEWIIIVKCWSVDGRISQSIRAKCRISPNNINDFPIQIPKKGVFSTKGDTLHSRWDINNVSNMRGDAKEWESVIYPYTPPTGTSENETITVNNKLFIYGTNGKENGFINTPSPALRLTNNAYAKTTVGIYNSKEDNWLRENGFTLSFTFKTDRHPYNDRTVLFMGEIDEYGKFNSGIKIDLESIYWTFEHDKGNAQMIAPIRQNTLTTVDFVYERTQNSDGTYDGMAKIFINGKIYCATEANTYKSRLPNDIYVGCAYSSLEKKIFNFADVNVYSLMVFSKSLNDMQIVINSHNARAERDANNNIIADKYNEWKQRNFFVGNDPLSPSSEIYKYIDNNYTYDSPGFNILKTSNPPIPILYLEALPGCQFTKEVYLNTKGDIASATQRYPGFRMFYYDSKSGQKDHIEADEIEISLQGTSTLKNKSKNLEIYFTKKLTDIYGDERTQLFQPREDWFPESQFTLKADVVDSAHANNATIGKWINTVAATTILEDTPPMKVVKENPPKDEAVLNGTKISFKDSDGNAIIQTPTIKHTIEGFQIILMIKFAGKSKTEILGIYSFNLGRASYYNMGMSFLKSFSRRKYDQELASWQDYAAPAMVNYYEPYERTEKIGNGSDAINLNEIYSYEFNSDGDRNEEEYNAWSQDTLSMIKFMGDFKFNGELGFASEDNTYGNNIWECLQELFKATARIQDGKKVYEYINNDYVEQDAQYTTNPDIYVEKLIERLSIKNAMAYYVIANAFGMVDSLGKNLTLRTWNANYGKRDENGYNKWYTCFYDMDTALGLTNQGNENVTTTVYIDSYTNKEVEKDSNELNTLIIKRNVQDPNGFSSYNSQLWNILRATTSIGEKSPLNRIGVWMWDFYEDVWTKLRKPNAPLSDYNTFVDSFTEQTYGCGELLYNLDYTTKYLTKFENEDGNIVYGDIKMLHGDRVEYIRKWLKDRFYFLDGVFAQKINNNVNLPYYNTGTIGCSGPIGGGPVHLTVNVTSPTIFTCEVGQNGNVYKYMLLPYQDTDLVLPAMAGAGNKIMSINSTPLITKLDGLKNNQFNNFKDISLPSFSQIDLNGVTSLIDDPIDFNSVFVYTEDGKRVSDIRYINLKGTSGARNFDVQVGEYNKINTIDISNSCVGSVKLPTVPLTDFKFSNSAIRSLTIEYQPYLTSLDFTGCKSLEHIKIISCESIKELNISSLLNLQEITISNCLRLEKITCEGNSKLDNFTIEACHNLKEVNITKCTNASLSINIIACDNITTLNFNGTQTDKNIILPSNVNNVTTLNLSNCIGFTSFQFGRDGIIEKINDENVLDLRPFVKLSSAGLKLNNCNSLKYVKFNNVKEEPFVLTSNYFTGCTNLNRVFGAVSLSGTGIFNECSNFYIHEEEQTNGVTNMPEKDAFDETNESNKGNVTNMFIKTNSLDSCFKNTNCNLYDVYYILQKCENVTSLSSTFSYCKNIKSNIKNSLHRDIFKYCGKVTNMGSLFYSTNVGGVLKSCKLNSSNKIIENGILTPCYSLQNLNSTFNTSATLYIDDKFFYKCKNSSGNETNLGLTAITYFSPYTLKDSNDNNLSECTSETIKNYYGAGSSSNLFTYLPSLKEIANSFNRGSYHFNDSKSIKGDDGVSYFYTDLFYNNTLLTSITNVFNGITGSGSLRNLFGGYNVTVNDKTHFPQKLKTIAGSFIINSGGVNMYIGNSFLQKIKDTITYITSTQVGNNTSTTTSSFNGDALIKYIDNEGGEAVSFPYKLFNGCKNLIEVPALLRGLRHINTYDGDDITLPIYTNNEGFKSSMFDGLTKLKNISYLFSNMSGFEYKLVGGGFKNCSLINVEGLFASSPSNNLNGNIKGQIPYGLFLQETNANYSTVYGLTKEMADELGIEDETYGIENCVFDNNGKVIVVFNENNEIVSGKTFPDGVVCPFKINEKGEVLDGADGREPQYAEAEECVPIPSDILTHAGKYKTINATITKMANVFAYSSSKNLQPYSYDIDVEDISFDEKTGEYNCPDLVIDNEKYNPILYFINDKFNPYAVIWDDNNKQYVRNDANYDPRRIIKNPNYNICKKKWNKWVGDGTNILAEKITSSKLYEDIQNGVHKDLPVELPIELTSNYIPQNRPMSTDIESSTIKDRFNTRNYLFAPDIFRYCKNDGETDITKAFYRCGGPDMSTPHYSAWDYAIDHGLYGILPPYLFESVTKVKKLTDMFYGVQNILPYKWGTAEENGIMYPVDLLKKLNNLTNINGLFRQTRVYNRCVIDDTFFIKNTSITDAKELFKDTVWGSNSNVPQISESLFSNNKNIIDVSGMFESSDSIGNNRFPRKMFKIFTPETHKAITNCSRFLRNATSNANGEVPEFWKWSPKITNITGCFPKQAGLFDNLDVTDEKVKPFLQ